jgi:hypothetical protein
MSNETRYWVPAKRFGWGWGLPVTWEGWLVFAAFLALLVAGAFIFPPRANLAAYLAYVVLLCAALVGVTWLKGRRRAGDGAKANRFERSRARGSYASAERPGEQGEAGAGGSIEVEHEARKKLVGVRGFEPPAPSSRTRCATRLRYTPTPPSRRRPAYSGASSAAQEASGAPFARFSTACPIPGGGVAAAPLAPQPSIR